MKKRVIPGIILAMIFVLQSAAAAESRTKLPPGVVATVTIRSPGNFIQAVDRFTVNATRKTASALPPGLITMLSHMYMPFSFDLWMSDDAAHIIVVPDETRDGFSFIGVFQVENVQTFLGALQENEWMVGSPAGSEDEYGIHPLLAPGGQTLSLADLGDGYVAVSDNSDAIIHSLLVGGWRPEVGSEADVRVVLPLEGETSVFMDEFSKTFAARKADFVGSLKQLGFTEAVQTGLATLVEKYAPRVVGLFGDVESGVFELVVDSQAILLDVAAEVKDGSLFHEMAVQAEQGRDLDMTDALRFGGDAISVFAGTSVQDIIPNAQERIGHINEDVIATVFPEFADEAASINRDAWKAGFGRVAGGGYILNDNQANFTLYRMDDPSLYKDVIARFVALMNKMADAAMDDPDLKISIKGGPVTTGDHEILEYHIEYSNRDQAEKWINRIMSMGDPELSGMRLVRLNPDFRIFAATLDKAVVLGMGTLTRADFVEKLQEITAGPPQPYLTLPPVETVVESLSPRQIMAGVVDAGGMYMMMATQNAAALDSFIPEGGINPIRAALPRFAENIIRDGSSFGISIGGLDGRIVFRIMLPAGTVNTMVRNHELLTRYQQEEVRKMIDRGRPTAPDGGNEGTVDGESPDGENEVELDLDEDPDAA